MKSNATTARLRVQIEALRHMTVRQLKERYLAAFGEVSRSNHKQYLFRRVAWRLQANALGGLSERARQRALAIANDSDLRISAPKGLRREMEGSPCIETRIAPSKDSRLPVPGTDLVRRHKGKEIVVRVRAAGFEFDGEVYRSLSAAVRAATGTPWNGFAFFGLGPERRREDGRN